MWQRLIPKKSQKSRGILSLTALLTLSIAVGCNQSNTDIVETSEQTPPAQEAATGEKIGVVATILPTYLFTKAVAGDVANVSIIVPPTTDVHDYQSTPDDVKAISTASILVKNGLGLEEFLESTIKNADNPNLVEIDASQGIQTLDKISPVDETVTEDGHSHAHEHDHAEGNPHVWLDPVLAKQQVTNIRDGLIAADPTNKNIYEANTAAYIQELENLDQEFQQTLQQTPNCTFITFHDAFPYLAQRYNLKQVAVVQLPEDQLSPADVQKAVEAVKNYNAKALFSEPGVDNKLLTSLAEDLNITVRNLDSLETASGNSNPEYYFQAMRNNLQTLQAGCK
ncbi:metal ABC transporter substrate-binding protein [Nodularia harveyana UHCC-0300]|uniref:Metal ABC transporter substrate-binding protein n=1 Tax=Nodularia harveyana UHCC-0300 TaxID=2974287 RepID=A0ABU5UI66_9CYAN|nr:metal ABC transporter substrate-binding protein [Nodularia harveyana]MEA5583241.1 metal ABC transporter substrate-binding protein [Nodularia harveyana UHCC-0300]